MLEQFLEFMNERKEEKRKAVEKRERKRMPQIDDFKAFMADTLSNNIYSMRETVNPQSLHPTQTNFNQEKIDSIIANKGYNTFPIIVTEDNYILDGHHRWKAALQAGVGIEINRVCIPFEDLFEFVDRKLYVKYKEINESKDINEVDYGQMGARYDYITQHKDSVVDAAAQAAEDDDYSLAEDGEGSSVNSVAGVDMGPGVPMKYTLRRKTD